MLKIEKYSDFSRFLENKLDPKGVVFGIGVTAFMRFFPGLFLKNYKVITLKDSKDNKILEQYAEIFCLKKSRPTIKLKYSNANNILRNKTIRNYILKHKGKKYLFLYRSNNNIQNAIKGLGVEIIANQAKINKLFENKANFRLALVKAGLQPIIGETLAFSDFQKKDYDYFYRKYGPKFVLQLPDYMLGGGKGTIFIDSKNKFTDFCQLTAEGYHKKKLLTQINVTKFIEGISCSIACCATRQGTLISRIQQQILDIPQVIAADKGNGLFVGHVFGSQFDPTIIRQAQKIGQQLGLSMYRQGYRGIFGLDLIIDKKNKKVYPVECNARYTGAFPMLSMLHLQNQIIPLDFFHFLELLKIPYQLDLKALNRMYQKLVLGSHLVLSNVHDYDLQVKHELEVGCYRYNAKSKKIEYRKPGIFYSDLQANSDFILVDGVPKKKEIIKKYTKLARIVHVLFKGNILNSKSQLQDKYLQIVKAIYIALFNKK